MSTFQLSAEEQAQAQALQARNKRWLLWLGGAALAFGVVAMVGLPPLYRWWCAATGTQLSPTAAGWAGEVRTGRFVTVYCDAVVADDLPVTFAPVLRELGRVEVGMDVQATYELRNDSDQELLIHPVHSVSPREAATPFVMKVCFCFNDFVLAPGEAKSFPIVFNLRPELPDAVANVRLCYHLFKKASTAAERQAQMERIRATVPGAVLSPPDAPGAIP